MRTSGSAGSSSGRTGSSRASSGARRRPRTSSDSQRRSRTSQEGGISGNVKTYTDYRVEEEIKICVILAVSILLLLGNIGFAGEVGRIVTGALFGVLGIVEWLFPFILFFGFSFYIANSMSRLIRRKTAGLIFLVVFACAFMQLVVYGYSRSDRFTRYYAVCSAERTGGGFVGSAVVYVFGRAFGTVGAWILVIFGLIISAIVMTQRPLFSEMNSRRHLAADDRHKRKALRDSYRRRAYRERHGHEYSETDMRAAQVHGTSARHSHSAVSGDSSASASYENPLQAVTLDHTKPYGTEGVSGRHAQAEKNMRSGDGTLRRTPDRSGRTAGNDRSEKTARTDRIDKTAGTDKTERIDAAGNRTSGQAFADDFSHIRIDGADFRMPEFLKEAGNKKEQTDRAENGGQSVRTQGSKQSARKEAGSYKTYKTAEQPETSSEKQRAEAGGAARATEDAVEKLHQTKEERERGVEKIALEIADGEKKKPEYKLPPVRLLAKGKSVRGDSRQHLMETAAKLQQTLQTFGVNVHVTGVSRGPTVTRYELQPEMGVKVSKILNLQDDIKLNLATPDIRIEAPIPGKAAVGIEVPNREVSPVTFRELVESEEFRNSKATLPFAVGKDIGGRVVVTDIEKMPHLLIAGATGSGKSVCINTLIMSILYKARPEDVKMLMIDPKVVELKIYDGIPHLLIPVVTDAKKAAGALNWAVQEMTNRYNNFAKYPGVRDIRAYNQRIIEENKTLPESGRKEKMPRIIIIVDELADLMMVASSEVEDAIVRITQLARACGIHLIVATQRPSVNVVTGLIKANMPSRIALAVSSGVDSRTILDMNGAEKLLGKGDMLFYPQGYPKPARVQGGFVSDQEITDVVKFLTAQSDETEYNKEVEEQIENGAVQAAGGNSSGGDSDRDEYFADAGRLIIEKEKASIGMLQRAFKIGFNRAARIMDQLADAGVVGGEEGTKPRKILMTSEEFEQFLAS